MSDLSMPPLEFVSTEPMPDVPVQAPSVKAQPIERGERFAWPTPPLTCYPAPALASAPEGCEVEGLNGKTLVGRLMHFNHVEGFVKLRVATSRGTISLRFDQFRRLRLLAPLAALPPPADTPQADVLAQRPALPFKVAVKGGEPIEGLSIGQVEADYGLFVFEPIDLAGTVRRSFFPRVAFESANIGQRLGEALVEQSVATPEQVQEAL